MESNSAKSKRSNPHFGRDPIIIGNFYLHQNTWAGKPMHFLVKVRSAFVDEIGYVRVGCSHPGRASEESVDEAFAETYQDGWAPEEVIAFGGNDPNYWEALYDDEVFLNPAGLPLILGNITGPGGSLWLSFVDDEFCEVVLDDDGNVIPST